MFESGELNLSTIIFTAIICIQCGRSVLVMTGPERGLVSGDEVKKVKNINTAKD